jgi:hypothetical protein
VTPVSENPRPLPVGKELWWTEVPDASKTWHVHEVVREPGSTIVTLKLTTGTKGVRIPAVGTTACFSINKFGWGFRHGLPAQAPWPLRPAAELEPEAIETDELVVA